MIDFWSEGFTARLAADQVAVDPDTEQVLLLSFAAPATTAKAVTAALVTDVPLRMHFADLPFTPRYHRSGRRAEAGYRVHRHNLGYGTWHCVLAARRDGFLPCISDAALWAALTSNRFTTPLLRDWMPWVRQTLVARRLLKDCDCAGCTAGLLSATSEDLDAVVSAGLKQGQLTIPKGLAAQAQLF
jgi:hypothetical protein